MSDSLPQHWDGPGNPNGDNQYHLFYGIFMGICCMMVVINIFCFFKYRAYNNLSSATLVMLVIMMFTWSSLIWALCFWMPPFFHQNFLTIMDLSNFIVSYFCGILNMSVILQWVQVYKVISDPCNAKETIIQNWASKMECLFVFYFTLVIVGSLYFSLWDHLDKDLSYTKLDTAKIVFLGINSATQFLLIILYAVLFFKFNRLINKQNDHLSSMKFQVVTFFTIAIIAMSLRLGTGIFEETISITNRLTNTVTS